ncbi:hypothetical protein THICB2_220003 [Thiomonas sp. CB2]|nr:hypothetical protein THICB2_220003 [Thiomonas sp. CB2]VDY05806.1 protein of unknown function [Thiomonas sp. Bio17B3]VDY10895.1 protein of unknown function [Thiomonas sp. Sup16B3]VDY14065.1 conserved protein of unknown function [Thiomonas sp. OC7]VDY16741.1 protein of unknown function [Thiomonas sp. CB2]
MDRYALVLSNLLERHSIRLSIEEATRLVLGKTKVTGYKLLREGKFPLPVHGGGKEDYYVRLQDVALSLCDVQLHQVAQSETPSTATRRRVGRPTRAEQLAEERRAALATRGAGE